MTEIECRHGIIYNQEEKQAIRDPHFPSIKVKRLQASYANSDRASEAVTPTAEKREKKV